MDNIIDYRPSLKYEKDINSTPKEIYVDSYESPTKNLSKAIASVYEIRPSYNITLLESCLDKIDNKLKELSSTKEVNDYIEGNINLDDQYNQVDGSIDVILYHALDKVINEVKTIYSLCKCCFYGDVNITLEDCHKIDEDLIAKIVSLETEDTNKVNYQAVNYDTKINNIINNYATDTNNFVSNVISSHYFAKNNNNIFNINKNFLEISNGNVVKLLLNSRYFIERNIDEDLVKKYLSQCYNLRNKLIDIQNGIYDENTKDYVHILKEAKMQTAEQFEKALVDFYKSIKQQNMYYKEFSNSYNVKCDIYNQL